MLTKGHSLEIDLHETDNESIEISQQISRRLSNDKVVTVHVHHHHNYGMHSPLNYPDLPAEDPFNVVHTPSLAVNQPITPFPKFVRKKCDEEQSEEKMNVRSPVAMDTLPVPAAVSKGTLPPAEPSRSQREGCSAGTKPQTVIRRSIASQPGDNQSEEDSELMYQSGPAAVAETPGQDHTPRATPYGSDGGQALKN